jgi:hypothetical protein
MTYIIRGLEPAQFEPFFAMTDPALAKSGAVRRASDGSFPCRVSLEDAPAGEEVILLNHVTHDVDGPFRTAYAICVRDRVEAAAYEGELPPVLRTRRVALRQFDREGMLVGAELSEPQETDATLRRLLEAEEVSTIHAHNPAYGCFLARIERS